MSRLAKIGLFVLITGVVTTVYMIKTASFLNAKETYRVAVDMDDASGLFVESNVRLAGVNVGKIRAIELVNGKARVVMELSKDVKLYEDAKVMKSIESLLGTSAIAINPGQKVESPLRAGGMIQSADSSNMMDSTFSNASEVTAEATLLVRELRGFLNNGGGYNTLKEILDSARDTVKTTNVLVEKNLLLLSSALQDINQVTRNVALNSRQDMERFSLILKNTADITTRIERLLGEPDAAGKDTTTQIREAVALARESIDKLNKTLAEVNGIAAKVNSGEGNVGKLVHDDQLYTKIVGMADNVQSYLDSTIGLDFQVGFQSDYLVDAGEARNQFGLRLTPKSKDKYYYIGFTDSPRLTEKTTTTATSITGTTTGNYTTTEIEKSRKLFLNAQIARRFGLFTLRGGVLESTGGLGVDFQPHERFSLSAELFDFGQTDAPYLRAYGTLYPFFDPGMSNPLNWIYLSGGVDNILLSKRDYFFGLGLRFRDNDLKGLTGFSSLATSK